MMSYDVEPEKEGRKALEELKGRCVVLRRIIKQELTMYLDGNAELTTFLQESAP
jgi:hypothetical protein